MSERPKLEIDKACPDLSIDEAFAYVGQARKIYDSIYTSHPHNNTPEKLFDMSGNGIRILANVVWKAAINRQKPLLDELLAELVTCRHDLARQAAELRQSVTVPGTDVILDEEDETLCEFEESRIVRLDALIAKAKEEA